MRRAVLLGVLVMLLVGCTARQHAKYPVRELEGQYTVVALLFFDDVDEDTGKVNAYACNLANDWAETLRSQGYKAHVADLGTKAAVAVGSYPNREAARRAAQGIAQAIQSLGGVQFSVRSTGVGKQTMTGFRPGPAVLDRLQRVSEELGY